MKENSLEVCDVTFSKPYCNWLNKEILHDMNQSDMMLEGQW